jgi:Chitobiase/beta-hexosaminidase C-terminal domain
MKKYLLPLVLLVFTTSLLATTYPVTDNFSGTGPLSSNWTNTAVANQGYVPLAQNNGVVVPSVSGQHGMALYTGASFSDDQYAQVKFVTHVPNSLSSTGVCVHMDVNGDGICYLADIGQLYFLVAGAGAANLNSSCPIPSSGDLIQLSVVGNAYSCTDITTGATSTVVPYLRYASGSPTILVDQRPSTAYALAQFQADCIPSCYSSSTTTALIFTPPSGSYNTPQTVTMTTPLSPATIYYTTDGSQPTTTSSIYTGPIQVSSSLVVNAIVVASVSASYVIGGVAVPSASPLFNPSGGSYAGAQEVTLSTTTPDAVIYYTTDGSTPTTASNIYSGAISVTYTQTINAVAVAPGFSTSAVSSATYTISLIPPAGGHTWYVNGNGGTRFSVNQTQGQCNGLYPDPYPGSGVNQNCAFNDIRYLWTDGSYTTNSNAGAPAWGWIGSGGDTYLIDCSNGAKCRIGQNGPGDNEGFGLQGNAFAAGMPPPLNGTALQHTRVLGVNYQNCTTSAAKAHVNGGYGVGDVFTLIGISYVDVACFDVTDFSSCGLSGQLNQCSKNYPLSDYASNGIEFTNTTHDTTVTDVSIHGMALNGILGATGNNVTLLRVALAGNAGAGWNMDDGSGSTGSGNLTLSYFEVTWSGCAEEYPIVDALPYTDCTDDTSGGYGDGLGTPGMSNQTTWHIAIDHSVAAYNTQDGFDALHLEGANSALFVDDSLMYANMGQQLKVGSAGTAVNNLIVGNCNALRVAIPGTPAGYNARLSNFCRAADVAVVLSVSDVFIPTIFYYNTIYSANSIAVEVQPSAISGCTTSCFMWYVNNIFLGFANNAANGYPSGGTGRFPTPIFFTSGTQVLSAPLSRFTNNLTFHARDNWPCPQVAWGEQDAVCADPGLVDERYPLYTYENMSPATETSNVIGKAVPVILVPTDYIGATRSLTAPTIGAIEGRLAEKQIYPLNNLPVP